VTDVFDQGIQQLPGFVIVSVSGMRVRGLRVVGAITGRLQFVAMRNGEVVGQRATAARQVRPAGQDALPPLVRNNLRVSAA
jgi:hypothetical protein